MHIRLLKSQKRMTLDHPQTLCRHHIETAGWIVLSCPVDIPFYGGRGVVPVFDLRPVSWAWPCPVLHNCGMVEYQESFKLDHLLKDELPVWAAHQDWSS